MADLAGKRKSVVEDVDRLRLQIRDQLNALIANRNLLEVQTEIATGRPRLSAPERTVTTASTSELQTKVNGRKTLFAQEKSKRARREPVVDAIEYSETGTYDGGMDVSSPDIRNTLHFANTTYTYLLSQTFLLPILDRWVWGTTIFNTSKRAAFVPDLTLTVASKTPFSYTYVVFLLDSNRRCSEKCLGALDLPFQVHGTQVSSGLEQTIKPGCKATLTATFESPVNSWSQGKRRIEIVAYLTLSGKFQWSQPINLDIGNVSTFKDETYERFKSQILSGMTSCQEKFRVERLLTQPQINQSLSVAFTQFLTSLGFKETNSDPANSSFACGLPSYLYGAIATLENLSNDLCHCYFSARSRRQMESLVMLLVSWKTQLLKNETTDHTSAENNHNSVSTVLISSLSRQPRRERDNEQRRSLLSEIEIVSHLVALQKKGLLSSSCVVPNWIRTFAAVSAKTDEAFS